MEKLIAVSISTSDSGIRVTTNKTERKDEYFESPEKGLEKTKFQRRQAIVGKYASAITAGFGLSTTIFHGAIGVGLIENSYGNLDTIRNFLAGLVVTHIASLVTGKFVDKEVAADRTIDKLKDWKYAMEAPTGQWIGPRKR